jgi:hypothetical protein
MNIVRGLVLLLFTGCAAICVYDRWTVQMELRSMRSQVFDLHRATTELYMSREYYLANWQEEARSIAEEVLTAVPPAND